MLTAASNFRWSMASFGGNSLFKTKSSSGKAGFFSSTFSFDIDVEFLDFIADRRFRFDLGDDFRSSCCDFFDFIDAATWIESGSDIAICSNAKYKVDEQRTTHRSPSRHKLENETHFTICFKVTTAKLYRSFLTWNTYLKINAKYILPNFCLRIAHYANFPQTVLLHKVNDFYFENKWKRFAIKKLNENFVEKHQKLINDLTLYKNKLIYIG